MSFVPVESLVNYPKRIHPLLKIAATGPFYNSASGVAKRRREFKASITADLTPAPEFSELIAAIDRYWQAVGVGGSNGLCAKCFSGTLWFTDDSGHAYKWRKGHINSRGCCGSCPHLGPEGCIAKPLDCALYECGAMKETVHGDYFQRPPSPWRGLRNYLSICNLHTGCGNYAYADMCRMQLDDAKRQQLRVARWFVETLTWFAQQEAA